jgi:hypothetical protein
MSKPKPNTHGEIKDLLNERNNTHGEFTENARISQGIKRVMETSVNWRIMPDIHRESLEYIAGKIGRILSGQYDYDDSWDDIGGFAGLPKKFNHGKENT